MEELTYLYNFTYLFSNYLTLNKYNLFKHVYINT